MGKHKKFIRSEKAKVKLKAIKLPKGLNVTKTEFKVRKIVIREQLQETNHTNDGTKKFNVKDILSRLRHHNVTFRTEALRNLKDCLTNSSLSDYFRDFASIIQGLSTLCLDIQRDIRQESFKVFSILLSQFDESTVKPFFHIISSYLRCAMTHLQQAIQEDSLQFLDILILYLPKLISANSDKIFSNFLEMISKLRTDAKPGRTLTDKIGNKTTTTKWRSKILDRLQKLLQLLLEDMKTESSSVLNPKESFYFKDTEPQNFQLFLGGCIQNCDLTDIFNRTISKNEFNETDKGEKIRNYITQLLPLLLESWLEVKPEIKEDETFRGQLLLSYEAACTLKIILQILNDLWEMAINWDRKINRSGYVSGLLRHKFLQDFTKHILPLFPYQQATVLNIKQSKKKQKTMKSNFINSGGQNCSQQNLSIIYLFSVVQRGQIAIRKKYAEEILQYLIKTHKRCGELTSESLALLEKVSRVILVVKGYEYLTYNVNKTKELLQIIIYKINNEILSKSSYDNILQILCEIVMNEKLYCKYGENEFKDWLPTLPLILLKTNITENTLQILSSLGKRRNKTFLNVLQQNAHKIIDNFTSIQIIGCYEKFESQKLIANLFFWIYNWSDGEKENFIRYIEEKIQDQEIVNYFCDILRSK